MEFSRQALIVARFPRVGMLFRKPRKRNGAVPSDVVDPPGIEAGTRRSSVYRSSALR